MSLPILTFDERVLSPRFGYVFQRRWLDPYESIIGMLWKFARLNRLPGQAVVMQLCRDPVDPYAGIDPGDVDVRSVARLLGVTQRSVRIGLPRRASVAIACLRFCPRCMSRGYHGAFHQLERHGRCPVHGNPIDAACRRCGRTSAYRLDAQLLDAPFRCRHCRGHYTASGAAPLMQRPALEAKDRVAITRAVIG